ncbi:MAG TPA: hypothetical protein VFL65_00820 [Jatrophihabitans sp.]|nr:hypothetical protein [Jatrophihabitans sp.]
MADSTESTDSTETTDDAESIESGAQGGATDQGDDALGEKGLRALHAERDARKAAEDRAKAAEAKIAEAERAKLTEKERLQLERDEAKKGAAESAAETARLRAAIKYKLDEADLEWLGTGTPDEIDERAKRLAERLAGKPADQGGKPGGGKPRESLRGGGDPTVEPDETDPAKLAAKVTRRF